MADRSAYEEQGNFQRISGIHEEKEVGKTGRPFFFDVTTNAIVGGWFNAAKAQLHFGAAGTGEVTGKASAFNAEIYMPNKTMAGGSYTVYEGNMNFQASSVVHSNLAIPLCLMDFNVGGTQAKIDTWEDSAGAGILHLGGLTAANGSVFATGGNAASNASLKIIIGSTAYYIMLTTTPSTT